MAKKGGGGMQCSCMKFFSGGFFKERMLGEVSFLAIHLYPSNCHLWPYTSFLCSESCKVICFPDNTSTVWCHLFYIYSYPRLPWEALKNLSPGHRMPFPAETWDRNQSLARVFTGKMVLLFSVAVNKLLLNLIAKNCSCISFFFLS